MLVPLPVAVSTAAPMPVLRAAQPALAADPPPPQAFADDTLAMIEDALSDCASALSAGERRHIASIIVRESDEHGYDPLFVTALVQVESGCSRTARGGDALGLVQMIPSTARDVARRAGVAWRGTATLTEPAANIAIGLAYLLELESQLGDTYRAVAAYNLGPARVARMSSRRAERTDYVRRILTRYEQLRAQHA
jgi:soluble lytic murein transglycosylase-like protein